MTTSESVKNIGTALLAFQVKVGTIGRDSENPFFKSRYASLTHILETIKDALNDCGLVVTQWPVENNGLTTMVIHSDSGEFIRTTYYMNPERDNPQGRGSCLSYMRRYSLTAALNLCFDDDDDGNAASVIYIPAHGKGDKSTSNDPAPLWKDGPTEITTISGNSNFPGKKSSGKAEPEEWLNENTPLFDKAVEKLKAGTTTIFKIRQAFKVSKKVEAALLAGAGVKK